MSVRASRLGPFRLAPESPAPDSPAVASTHSCTRLKLGSQGLGDGGPDPIVLGHAVDALGRAATHVLAQRFLTDAATSLPLRRRLRPFRKKKSPLEIRDFRRATFESTLGASSVGRRNPPPPARGHRATHIGDLDPVLGDAGDLDGAACVAPDDTVSAPEREPHAALRGCSPRTRRVATEAE